MRLTLLIDFETAQNIFWHFMYCALCIHWPYISGNTSSQFYAKKLLSQKFFLFIACLALHKQGEKNFILAWYLTNSRKELSLCHKLWFSNPYIFETQCLRPNIFQTKYTVRSNNLSLKYQRFTPSGSKDIGDLKFLVCDKNSIPLP